MRIRVSFVTDVDDEQDAREVAVAVQQLLWDIDAGPEEMPAWESVDGE